MTSLGLCCMVALLAFLPQALPASQDTSGLEGAWRGSLNTGVADLSLLLTVEKSGESYTGKLNSLDQVSIIPADTIRVDGDSVHLEFTAIKGTFDGDRKSTRLNSSHLGISYAVFCLKKK